MNSWLNFLLIKSFSKSNEADAAKLQSGMQRQTGLLIIVVGAAMVFVGLIAYFGGLSWFGNLPGDIKIERGNTRIYFPLVSMLLISVLLSLIMYLVRRFL